eukprot:656337-Prymnesium_polylepis.1
MMQIEGQSAPLCSAREREGGVVLGSSAGAELSYTVNYTLSKESETETVSALASAPKLYGANRNAAEEEEEDSYSGRGHVDTNRQGME